MKGHWERVRTVLRCAYGCDIKHAEWAWFGRYPFVVCESCAARYGIHREPLPPPTADLEQSDLVPASPDRPKFTGIGEIAAEFEASPGRVVRAARAKRWKR